MIEALIIMGVCSLFLIFGHYMGFCRGFKSGYSKSPLCNPSYNVPAPISLVEKNMQKVDCIMRVPMEKLSKSRTRQSSWVEDEICKRIGHELLNLGIINPVILEYNTGACRDAMDIGASIYAAAIPISDMYPQLLSLRNAHGQSNL